MTPRWVVAVVPDLFFASRIAGSAERLGIALTLAAPAEALAVIRDAPPHLVILDLSAAGDPLVLVRALRADPGTRSVRILGFYPHVERALREAALAAGVDQVLPRSAFTARLAPLLAGAGEPGTGRPAGLLD